MVDHLLEKYEGRDLGVSDKLKDVALMTSKSTKPEQAQLYSKIIVFGGLGSFDVLYKVSTQRDPGRDLSLRQENKNDLDASTFPYARKWGNSCSRTKWRDRASLAAFEGLVDESNLPGCASGGDYSVCFVITLDVGINKENYNHIINALVGIGIWLDMASRRRLSRYLYFYRWLTNRVEIKITSVSFSTNIEDRVDSDGSLCVL